MDRKKALAKNTFILTIGNVLPKAVSFVVLPILTAYLTKSEYGTYDLINTLASLLLPVLTLQMQAAAFRFLIELRSNEHEQKRIITNIYCFTGTVSVVALLILFFVLRGISITTRVFICVYFLLDILIATSRQVVRGLGKNQVYTISAIINSTVNLLFIVVFVRFYHMGLDGVILSLSIALLASQLFILIKINLKSYLDFKLIDKNVIKQMLQYSWPMVPNSLSGWVMRLSDRLVITAFIGVEANAVYSVANKLPILFSVLQNTFNLAWQENASLASSDSDSEKYYSEMFNVMYALFFTIMAWLIAVTPLLWEMLIRGDYGEAYYQMPILYLGMFFNSLSAYLGGIYVAKMETKKVGISTTLAAVCNVSIDLLLVRSIGIFAGSISTLISYVILTVYRMVDVQKIQKIRYRYRRLFTLFIIIVMMCIFSFQNTILFNFVNVALAVVTTLIVNYSMLKQILKKIKQKKLHL